MKSAHKLYETLWVLVFFVIMTALASPSLAANVTITAVDQGSGGVALTANGTFETCTYCDAQGENCQSSNGGWVSIDPYYYYCSASGNGSATCTKIIDRAALEGTHTFNASANDCIGSSSASTTLTIDNTSTISATGPSGTVSAPFDITGTATFKPSLTECKGAIYAYTNEGLLSYSKMCFSENCNYSYKELSNNLYDYPHGGPYTFTLRAVGNGNESTSSATTTFTVDKTPTASITGPNGELSGSFNITGTAAFKPTLSPNKGTISALINGADVGATKNCTTEICTYDYQALTNTLYTLPPLPLNQSYTVQLTANGSMGGTATDQKTFFVEDLIPGQGCPEPPPGTCPLCQR